MPVMTRAEKLSYDQAVVDVKTKLSKSGSEPMEGDMNMAKHKVTQVGDAVAADDATTLSQVEKKFTLGSIKARRRQLKGK